jgi:sugar phosphate permease
MARNSSGPHNPPEASGSHGVPRIWPFRGTYYGWAIVGASFLATLGEVPVFGPVLGVFITPIEEELGWSRATIAFGFTAGTMTGSIASIVVGRLVDRYGARVVMALAGLLVSAALLGMSRMNEPWQFWVLFGVGRGSAITGVEVGASVAVANWFYRKRGRALGIKSMGQRIGQTLVPFGILGIMSVSDWRMGYVALSGLVVLLITVPSVLFMRRRPEDLGLLPDGDLRRTGEGGTPERPARAAEVSWTLAEALHTRAFWLIALFTTGTPLVQGSTNLHLVANLIDRGLPDVQAVSVLAIFGAVSALVIMPLGMLFDHVHVRFGAMFMAAVLVVAMLLISVADSFAEAVVFAGLFGLATGMRSVVETLLVANYFGRESMGTIKGFMGPFRIVSPIGPVFAGFVRDTTGSYGPAFMVFAGMAVLMLAAMFFARQPRRPEPEPGAGGEPGL